MTKVQWLLKRLAGGRWDEIAVRDAILEVELGAQEKLVLLALLSHANRDHQVGGPRGLSTRRIAELASVSKNRQTTMVAGLAAKGLLRVTCAPGHRQGRTFDLSALPHVLCSMLKKLSPIGDSSHQPSPVGDSSHENCPPTPPQLSPKRDPTVPQLGDPTDLRRNKLKETRAGARGSKVDGAEGQKQSGRQRARTAPDRLRPDELAKLIEINFGPLPERPAALARAGPRAELAAEASS